MHGKENLRKRRQLKTNYLWIHKSKLQGCINSRRYFFLWRIMAGMFLFLLIITTKVQAELFGFHFQIKDGTSFSEENTLWTGKTRSIMSCSHLCARREACKIAMFWVNQRTCLLLDTAQREEGQKRPQQDDVFYLERFGNMKFISLQRLDFFKIILWNCKMLGALEIRRFSW